jgi:hypothetical protein
VLLVLLFSGVAGSWNGVLQRVLHRLPTTRATSTRVIGDRSRRGCRLAIFAGSLPVHSQPPTTRSARTASLGLPGEADRHACVRCQ